MTCYHPVQIGVFRKERYPGDERKWTRQEVGCGHCIGCRTDQSKDWSIRILHETECHPAAWFLTLTYNDHQIPENGSLRPDDLSAFFKDLRRDYPPQTLSYFACGEYGGETRRPHYHAVLYGLKLPDRYPWRKNESNQLWRSPSLEKRWEHGFVEFGTVTPASAQYVASYVQKKVHRLDDPDHYIKVNPDTGEVVDLQPEFSRMSRRPAIGKTWIKKNWRDVYPRDYIVVDGHKKRPPRFYDKWADENIPAIMQLVREKRALAGEEVPLETLRNREINHVARNQLHRKGNAI